MEVWNEEEVVEVGLRGRPPHQHRQTTTTTTPTERVEASKSNQEINGKLESGIFFDNNGVSGEPIDGLSGSKDDANNVDISISKTASLLQSSIISLEQHISHATSSNNGTTIDVIREIRQDETELYLDQVFKKPIAHEFVCPNCNSCIKKVLVREWDTDSALIPEPIDTIRCSSCFSFLIPAGKFFSNFIPKPKQEQRRNEQEANPVQDPLMKRDSLLETIHDKTKPLPNDESILAPPTKIVPPPIETVGESLDLGTAKPQETGKDNVAYPKPDSAEKEDVEIGRGLSSVDHAMGDEYIDDKYSQKTEPDEGLKIQVNVKTEKSDTAAVETAIPPIASIIVNVDEDSQNLPSEPRNDKKWEIIKSIVYGGLTESITSLSVVTSAASADATTLNIIALALANIVGGLFMIGHNLRELKNEQSGETSDQTNERIDSYQELLGKRENFILHATVSILSFLVFGLVPPLVYGFSFRKSDDKDYKLAAVAAASFLCITILAIGKAYVRNPLKNYIKTVLYYVVAGFMASGVSYLAGELIRKLIEKFGWFNSDAAVTMPFADISSGRPEWASY